jgi:signal transduction histidine kinase
MLDTQIEIASDVLAVGLIDAVPTLLQVLLETTGMGFAAVARVTEDRWIACCVKDEIEFGLLPGGELKVATTICDEIRQSGTAVVIDNVAQHPLYCGHPTPAMYGFQSYISVPIVLPDGQFFGTLCAIDPRPARVNTPEVVGIFNLFAQLIGFHLDALDRIAASEAHLLDERRTSELREQFIAVLGHDLRNPLAAISAGAELLLKTPLNPKATRLVGVIRASATRMSGLIEDVMDFARGRLGTGLALRQDVEPLEPVLRHVLDELKAGFPDRAIDAVIAVTDPVRCDAGRIAQLLSNLVGNALTYGDAARPVQVRAVTGGETFELSVANEGDPISAAAQARLFQPFERGAVQPNQQGLGLGLFIASEIARAHGGTLDVMSTEVQTRFTFRMPLVRAEAPSPSRGDLTDSARI